MIQFLQADRLYVLVDQTFAALTYKATISEMVHLCMLLTMLKTSYLLSFKSVEIKQIFHLVQMIQDDQRETRDLFRSFAFLYWNSFTGVLIPIRREINLQK